ncbi:MAG: dual specificity protein phosphatase family protein [Chloroflexi bacterium]|nr:dual specificity protein phosphatase family protein [Chloroflexota bacterium]
MGLPPNFRWFDQWVAGAAKPLPDELDDLATQEHIFGLVRLETLEGSKVTPEQVAAAGMVDLHEPIDNRFVPTLEQAERVLAFIHGMVASERKVLVTCGVGAGRTGTIVACYFVDKGLDGEAAIRLVGCLQEPAQERFVRQYAELRRARSAADGG